MKNIFTLVLALAALWSSAQKLPATNADVDAAAFEQAIKVKGVQVVDVRTPREYQGGHIAGAVNIDWNDDNFKAAIQKLDKSKPVAIYCYAGGRSEEAKAWMKANGFKNVIQLVGGIEEWRDAKKPVVK
jgi:rhodanese-related sulfurtransferase